MAAVDGDPEVGRQRREPLRGERRQEPAGEPERVERRVLERLHPRLGEGHVEEAGVEREVVGHEHGVAQELDEPRHRLGRRRLAVDHGRRDPSQPGDPARDVAAGVDELLERVDDLAADEADGRDLDQAVVARPGSGGLGVDDDERGLVGGHGGQKFATGSGRPLTPAVSHTPHNSPCGALRARAPLAGAIRPWASLSATAPG